MGNMTVKELIDELSSFDDNVTVIMDIGDPDCTFTIDVVEKHFGFCVLVSIDDE